jgi:fructose-1,6-bisphosphatase
MFRAKNKNASMVKPKDVYPFCFLFFPLNMSFTGVQTIFIVVITNDIMKNALRFSGKVGVLASEEEDTPMSLGNTDKYKDVRTFRTQFNSDVLIEETGGKYVAVFDPLDGSSNVDAGIPTGTIFGIFDNGDGDEVRAHTLQLFSPK